MSSTIISFYSYKGGVGRSQLCANIAAYLCHTKGKKVLLWDWDFEAPGLHFFFGKKNEDINKPGTLELFESFVYLMRSTVDVTIKELTLPDEHNIIKLSEVTTRSGDKGRVDLLAAGNYIDGFGYRSNLFNWYEFYERLDGKTYIDNFKLRLNELGYDYILIDSRTGISDYSGICNIQLPQINVVVMAANDQNFSGSKQVIEQIQSSGTDRLILPILSRLDQCHPSFENWIDRFCQNFFYLLNSLDPGLDADFTSEVFRDAYVAQTFLEYIPTYSAGENVFITEQRSFSRLSFTQKYVNIAEFIETLKSKGSLQIVDQVDKDTWIYYAEAAEWMSEVESSNREFYVEKVKKAYYFAGDLDKCISFGGIPEAFSDKGDEAHSQGEYNKAIEFYSKALDLNPNESSILNNIGSAYINKGEAQKALFYLDKAIEIDNNNFRAWFNMGIAYSEIKDQKNALNAFNRASTIEPLDNEVWYEIGESHMKQEEFQSALNAFKKSDSLLSSYETLLRISHCHFSLNNFRDAFDFCYRSINKNANSGSCYATLGFYFIVDGQLDRAVPELERAIELKCYDSGYMNMGHVHLCAGRHQQALEFYDMGIKSKDPHLFLHEMSKDLRYLTQYGVSESEFNSILKKLSEDNIMSSRGISIPR